MKHWAEEVLDEYIQEQHENGVSIDGSYDPQSRVIRLRFSKGVQSETADLPVGELEDMTIYGTDSPIFVRRSSLNTQLMLLAMRLGF